MNIVCAPITCPALISSACVFYEGSALTYIGINQNDSVQTALQKINAKIQDAQVGYTFQNGLIQVSPGDPVELGGSLLQDTPIGGAFTLSFPAGNLSSVNVTADALITNGGTSSDFVKGDGSLDSTSYQPTGSYLTALTGDGTATGPGSSTFTLATVNATTGTFGSGTTIPVITVNGKGLVTSVVNTAVSFPSTSLSFGGDVTGLGNTGSLTTLTLQTVNATPFGVITPLKIRVNGKGLVTSAAPITNIDLDAIYGYTPYSDTNPAGYISTIAGILAGGDLSGSYPNPTVSKIRNNTIPVNAVGALTNDGFGNLSWSLTGGGSGTVTNFSFTNNSTFSGVVANSSTTPNLTLTLLLVDGGTW
jgi:hypothetical protein